jgi:RimJ/RimL family protein N-acetyltransferase
VDVWPTAQPVTSLRLLLEPLRRDHAVEAAAAFGDADVYRFIGGEPPTVEQLRARYDRQVAGHSPDGREGWLNWMSRLRTTSRLVGSVQATLTREVGGQVVAELAWVVAQPDQAQGYATEAAAAVRQWLQRRGVHRFAAHIHPEHAASGRVAWHLGMEPTGVVQDGEIRWTSTH